MLIGVLEELGGIGGAGRVAEGWSFVVVVVGSCIGSVSRDVPFVVVVESNKAVKLGPRSSAIRDNSSVVVVVPLSVVVRVVDSEVITGMMGSVVVVVGSVVVSANGAVVNSGSVCGSTRRVTASTALVSILTPCPSGYG